MSRDHHSPMVSSERATGHALVLKDLCRIAPSSYLLTKSGCIIIPESRIVRVVASCNQTGRRRVARLIRLQEPNATSEPNSNSEEGYIPMKSIDKAVELSAQTTRNVFKRNLTRFAPVLLAALAGLVAVPNATVAAAPQHRDQVPGFYRLKVGDLEVTALYDGTGVFDRHWLNGTKARVDGVVKALQEDPHLLDVVDTGFLVNTGKQLILIDAGAGTWWGEGALGRLAGSLRTQAT